MKPDPRRWILLALTLGLIVATGVTVAAFVAPLVLAAWFADVLQPAVSRLQRRLGGRRRGAAAIVVLLVTTLLAPLGGLAIVVVAGVRDILAQATAALESGETLSSALLGRAGHAPPSLRDWADLASRYGAQAWRAASAIAHTSVAVMLAVLVFVVALYALAADGRALHRWLLRNAPLGHDELTRLTRAFRETGRGLLIGGGGTALAQGAAATLVFVAIGVPRALVLGPLTAVAGLVPVVGTGLVWIPLAIGLAMSGDYARATVVAIAGAGVFSLFDNFLRPVLTRYGKLELPTVLVLVSMLGGIAAFGAAGALLGPLVARLTIEALAIAREKHVFLPAPERDGARVSKLKRHVDRAENAAE